MDKKAQVSWDHERHFVSTNFVRQVLKMPCLWQYGGQGGLSNHCMLHNCGQYLVVSVARRTLPSLYRFWSRLLTASRNSHAHCGLKWSKAAERRQGNIECTVDANVALWNVVFRSFLNGSTALCWALSAVSVSYPYMQSVCVLRRGISPWQNLHLPMYRKAETQNKHIQTSMPRVGFEPMTSVFEQAKTVHALHRATTVSGKVMTIRMWNMPAKGKHFPVKNTHGEVPIGRIHIPFPHDASHVRYCTVNEREVNYNKTDTNKWLLQYTRSLALRWMSGIPYPLGARHLLFTTSISTLRSHDLVSDP
jgi:hypothetical protein